MDVHITPRPLSGTVRAIPSKSFAHRLLICSALCEAPTDILLPSGSEDISATLGCLEAMGAGFLRDGDTLRVSPIVSPDGEPLLDCRESGSTLRFLLPVAAALFPSAGFTGSGRLPQRPVRELIEELERHGAVFSANTLPFSVSGRLRSGAFALPGRVSSQYVSGLLLALPLLGGDSSIILRSPLVSKRYVDITLSALRQFGVRVWETEKGWHVPGLQHFSSPGAAAVEGDWTNAAVFLCCGALAGPVTVAGLDAASLQGDKSVVDIIQRFGAEIKTGGDSVTVSPCPLRGCEIDSADIPDLVPALAVLGAFAKGETRIYNAGRLRSKESDRLMATAAMINALGGEARETRDGLEIRGGGLTGGAVSAMGDHRIAMAAALAAAGSPAPVCITGAEAVRKSYPAFFEDYTALGGQTNVI